MSRPAPERLTDILAAIDRQPDMSVVGQAVDTRDSLPTIVAAEPDIIMVDALLAQPLPEQAPAANGAEIIASQLLERFLL